jgi:hypothetical protein
MSSAAASKIPASFLQFAFSHSSVSRQGRFRMTANAEGPPRRARSRGLWATAVVVFFCLIGIGAFLLIEAGNRRRQEECEHLAAQMNEAVGYLEAGQLDKADAVLSDLARRFPREPAAVRNLAICRVLAVVQPQKQEGGEISPAPAQAALDALRSLEPGSPVPHVLAARLAAHLQDTPTAVAELHAAGKLAADDAPIWYDLSVVGESAADDELRSAAIDSALKAAPTNSWLLKEKLLSQTRRKDVEALETLKTLRAQIEPILESVKVHARGSDVDEFARRLIEAVDKGNWQQAQTQANFINNVIKPEEWVRSDLRRLKRHLLSHVVLQFSQAVCDPLPPASRNDQARTAVTFHAAVGPGQLPPRPRVRALNLSDFDLDGLPDVIALAERELAVISRANAAAEWEVVLTVPVREPMHKLLVGDLDRDLRPGTRPLADRAKAAREANESAIGGGSCQGGDVEIVVLGPGGVQVFRNDVDADGKRTLIAVEQDPALEGLRDVRGGVLADIDHDGDLDLVLSAGGGVSLWLNEGQLKFAEATSRSALPPAALAATSLVAVDWDRDLDIDVLVSGPDDVPAGWLENLRHGSMRWREFDPELSRLTGSECLNVVDVDGNASWDAAGGGPQGLRLVRTRTESPGDVRSIDFTQVSSDPFTGSLAGDFDNDTHPDLLAWGPTGVKLFWGTSAARFNPGEGALSIPPSEIADCAAADVDRDGDLDLVIAGPEGPVLYMNEGGNTNHWLAVRAQGEEGDNQNTGDVNHLGIGSVLEVKTGRHYQAQIVTGQVTHFGLGRNRAADVLRVIWTNGVPQPAVAPPADENLCRMHVIGTSCPYFYTWSGQRFEFCTDACWAAPLGLQLAEDVFAEPRAWEYLLVPGDRLKAKEGRYLIQMTEELWEATYLDRMELIAVDHPADVEVFSNEKVGPPELAEFKIHTVRDRRLPVTARDKHGRDVLDEIAREDGVFMKGFDGAPRRGLTDDHYLELDLGPLDHPQKLTLFLTGWLYPASTSLRVGVSNDPTAPAPRPPALEVPDAHGNWQVVRPFMGFPGGRTKTIAVDLSGIFLTSDYRLRIATNMEFYWDAAFFSFDEETSPIQLTHLSVASADLHYRGYSEIIRSSQFGPPAYDYNRVSTAPRWAPMAGRFTRYGDVTELLQEEDDLQVVFGSGDEITVAFDVPASDSPVGWKRDFLLHNVGWDKDNDLNVVTSQEVEPLPFRGMSGYPYRGDEQFPETPRHREYLQKYQTREQFPLRFWREVQQSHHDDAHRQQLHQANGRAPP